MRKNISYGTPKYFLSNAPIFSIERLDISIGIPSHFHRNVCTFRERPTLRSLEIKSWFCPNLETDKVLKRFVIQSVSEESRLHKVNAFEILPPFGRLNDTENGFSLKTAIVIAPKFGQNQKVCKNILQKNQLALTI